MNDQILAILGAQFRAIYNRMGGQGALAGRIFYWVASGIWYAGMLFLAWLAATGLPSIQSRETVGLAVSGALAAGMLFWQLTPVILASTGMGLDLKKLMVYPIPERRLFTIEALLRVSTGVEVLIVMAGLAVGLARRGDTPWYGFLGFLLFVVFNLTLSAGVRDLLARALQKKGVRELVVLGIVSIGALPQLIMVLFPPKRWKALYEMYGHRIPSFPWPWQVTAQAGMGERPLWAWGWLIVWTVAAAWFGYRQFLKGLSWDADEARSAERKETGGREWLSWFYAWPGRLFRDPLGALVEKELRTLSRTPRFRLVFFMGFSFGLLIWLPLIVGRNRGSEGFRENILVWVSLYAAMLLGEVLFWNMFGFDRTAAQAYFVMPVKMRTVLAAKNIAAVVFLLAEVGVVAVVVSALRIGFPLYKVGEAVAVCLLMCVHLLAMGNLSSVNYPRSMDGSQIWRRSGNAKVGILMVFGYPVLGVPVALSYAARWAFESQAAFYLVLGAAFVVAGLAYWVSMESAVETAERRKEEMLASLSRGEGPIG